MDLDGFIMTANPRHPGTWKDKLYLSPRNQPLICEISDLKKTPFIFFFLLCIHFFMQQADAQYKFDKSVVLNREMGLPTNYIRCIAKGEGGFVWIGTSSGLSRFDGLEFRNYKPEPGNPYSLLSAEVNAVLAEKNRIWVATSLGISVLDLHTNKFRNYQFIKGARTDTVINQAGLEIYSFCKDNSGDIWIGSRNLGICRYIPSADTFQFYYYKPGPNAAVKIPDGYLRILSIEYCRKNDSIVWAGTLSGLMEINKFTGAVRMHYYPQEDKDYETSVNAFRRIYLHDDGLLYCGSWRAGVNIYDPATHTLTSLASQLKKGSEMLKTAVSGIRRKDSQHLWITTALGLLEYNTATKEIVAEKQNQLRDNIFYGADFTDDRNRVWTSNINGVHIFDPLLQQFRFASFEHLFIEGRWGFCFYLNYDSAANNILVCPRVTDGLYIYNRTSQQWTKLPFRLGPGVPKQASFTVRGFARQDDDHFTVSSDEGLFTYTKSTGTLSLFPYQPKLVYRRYGSLLWDKDKRLWLCADIDGLIRWDSKTGKAEVFKSELELYRPTASSPGLIDLYMDSKRNIWISRPGGYSVYDYTKDTFSTFGYYNQPGKSFQLVYNFMEDRQGRVWISGRSGWVGYAYASEPSKGMQQKIALTEQGKRIEDDFHTLATDSKGNIWGCSNTHLIKLNPRTFNAETFSYRYGIEEIDFFGFIILPDDELVLGGRNNIVLAHPYDLTRNTEAPRPYLTGINVRQQPYTGSIPVFGEEQLKLSYYQNFFSFSFSAQAFSLGKETRFRYRLKGFDDWIETREGRLANYTNVPGGDYVFQLQAANNEGVWSEHMLEVPIFIGTAWWKTWWFRVAAVLALLGISYWLYRWRIQQVRQKEYIRSEFEKKLANVEMSALRAQMNPHFLFNSLNSIDSYIIRSETKKASEYLNNFARLIRLILQNSRSNYISLKDELETLELYLQMESLRFKNKFRYRIEVQEGLDTSTIDIPPMLIQPYVENAIWHGLMHHEKETGCVKISIHEQDGKLLCVVEDNGIGREKAMEIRAKKSGASRRSMGMTITQDRIEIINKLYDTHTSVQVTDLTDEAGKSAGTKVELKIPV